MGFRYRDLEGHRNCLRQCHQHLAVYIPAKGGPEVPSLAQHFWASWRWQVIFSMSKKNSEIKERGYIHWEWQSWGSHFKMFVKCLTVSYSDFLWVSPVESLAGEICCWGAVRAADGERVGLSQDGQRQLWIQFAIYQIAHCCMVVIKHFMQMLFSFKDKSCVI